MINHARTLILNRGAADRPELGTYGEEYIPAAYQRLDYAGHLQRVRNTLLGTFGDPLYENYRLAQYMSIVHANQYTEELALGLDSRFTYRPFEPSFMSFDTSIETQEINSKGLVLSATGTPTVNESVGRALYRSSVRTLAGPSLAVKDVSNNQWVEYDVTITSSETNTIELENGVLLQITVPGAWEEGAEWLVTSMARPTKDLGYFVASLDSLGPNTLYSLFQASSDTYRNLWYSGVSLVDQLGGVLGAFIHAAEEIRTNV